MREVRTVLLGRPGLQILLGTALVLFLHADRSAAQGYADWVKQAVPGPLPRIEDGFVYDSVANRMIMFGGYDLNWNRLNDIWFYDAGNKVWTDVTPPTGALPIRRSGVAMSYDPVRRVVVIFGGLDDKQNFLGDTWEFDTVARTWSLKSPGTSPSPRQACRLVYDALNNRTILVGGVDSSTYYNQTWSWNGNNWTLLTTSVSSPTGRPFAGRAMPGATYNSATNRVVVFGGVGDPTPTDFNDIWELRNGPGGSLTWTDVTPASGSPVGRGWMQLAYDASANRIIMLGGYSLKGGPVGYADTWAFSNGAWTLIVPEGSFPGERDSYGMAYDAARQKVVVFGGYLADVIELTGVTWERDQLWNWPPGQDGHAMAYDSDQDQVFMYGSGSPESWELNVPTGIWTWQYVLGPNGRAGSTVVYDSVQHKMLLFGGRQRSQGTYGSKLGDTWVWDTVAHTWTNVSPGGSPSARDGQAMAYDAAHNLTVLYGGSDVNNVANGETWLWNGSSWSNVTASAGGPSARYGHAMAYDPIRRVVVLFGGTNGAQNFNDTWEWNGDALRWQQLFPAGPVPSARAYSALSPFDAATPGVAMFGGVGAASTVLNDAWLWNGSTWTQASNGGTPTPRQHPAMVYDSAAKRLVMYGGRDARGVSPELFTGVVTNSSVWPAPISISPSQGQGAAAGFYGLFRHASGASLIREAHILINSTLTGANGVYVVYLPSSNTLMLANDAGTAWSSGVVGSTGTLSNSQVTINLAQTAALVSGTDVGVYFYATFKNSFNGAKNVYMTAIDTNGADPSGWQQKGTFLVSAGNSPPQMISVTPTAGAGWFQDFTAVYRDPNGVGDLQQTYFLINNPLIIRNGVDIYFVPSTNMVYLRDDADTSFGAGALAGSAAFLSNSQVTIDVSRVVVSRGATDLTVTFPLTFSPSFAGPKTVYMWGVDYQGATPPGWQAMGTWTVGPPPKRNDFDGAGGSDILWRHTSGAVTLWLMNGTAVVGGGSVSTVDPTWQIAGTGDYNGDGRADILWRNTSGAVTIWFMNGTTIIGGGSVGTVDPTWQIAGTGDYNGDGRADILWRNTSGAVTIWFMNGTTIIGGGSVLTVDPSWQIAGTGDYNGDGHADILWRNTSGAVAIWLMNGTTVVGGGSVSTVDAAWQIAGTGDYNGDGRADILWRNTSGEVTVWLMNGTTIIAGGSVSTVDLTWQIAGTGDYNGDGRADILWRNTSGAALIWFMDGSQVVGGGPIGSVDSAWQVVNTL